MNFLWVIYLVMVLATAGVLLACIVIDGVIDLIERGD